MRFKKHAFNAWVEKPAFYHTLKSLMLTYYNPCIKIVFLERTSKARSGKCMFYKMPIIRTLLDVRKTCINARTLNMRYSIYTFTMCFKNACFTHVAHFPMYMTEISLHVTYNTNKLKPPVFM